MNNLEKVIKGLENCNSGSFSCQKCPYNEKKECENKGFFYSQAIGDAIQMLKEQEAVIPDTNGYEWVCGSCKYPVELERKTSPQTWFHSTLYSYCPNCGKKVKWE